MVMCWAPDCKHYNQRETCKFFKFPSDEILRRKWKNLVRRDVEPGPGAFLCSCHFPDGKRENLPVLFEHNREKRMKFSSPEKRTRLLNTSLEKENIEQEILENLQEPQPTTSQGKACASAFLETENYFLKKELAERQVHTQCVPFSFDSISANDSLIRLNTGLPTAKIFYELLENIPLNYYLKWKVDKIKKVDQLLMCLMKLRQNFPHEDLAQRFNVSQAMVTNVTITWLYVLHEILFKQLMKSMPSRKKNQTCLPSCFSTFTNCRVILDCTEMTTMVPRSSMSQQKSTYSNYKRRNTWKTLIGVAPNGVVTFVSTLYPGSTSDKKIVKHCGILKMLETGDLILADKGFLLKDILPPGIHLNVPPFLVSSQFTPEQVQQTETIARARIHVERAIQRMKLYKIINFIPRTLYNHAGVIVQVIGALTNLHYPLLKEVAHLYSSDESD